MLQQQQKINAHPCPHCRQKQQVIDKYAHLVSLLKRKTQKRQDSKNKDYTASSQITTELNYVTHAIKAQQLAHLVEKITNRKLQQTLTQIRVYPTSRLFPLMASQQNSELPSLQSELAKNPKSVGAVRMATQGSKQLEWANKNSSSMIAMSTGFLEELFKFKNTEKFQLKKIFELTHQKQALQHTLKSRQAQLAEYIRRQEKQIAKKRESLQGLADELIEKSETIEELRETIKSLEMKLLAKDNQALHRMLEEDTEALRRIISKLENVNDKLNHDISMLKEEKNAQQQQNKELSLQLSAQVLEVKALKEEVFSFEHQKQQNSLFKRQVDLLNQKTSFKLQRLKRLQKKLSDLSKIRDSQSTQSDCQKKNIETTLHLKGDEMKEIEMQNKLEAVFNYLFNIENEQHQLESPELFDSEEKELLETHKARFLHNGKISKEDIPAHSVRNIEGIQQPTDLVAFGDSIFQAFQETPKEPTPTVSNIKMMELEIERSKMIEKITEIKERQLHMRSVILQFIKSLDLRSIKKETEGIITVLCDFFEYSEEERALAQTKPKKFLGFI